MERHEIEDRGFGNSSEYRFQGKTWPVPFHRFEKRPEFRQNEQGDMEIAYVKVPVVDNDGKPVFEEYSFPNGTTFRRPQTKDDETQPISRVYLYIRPFGSKDEIPHDAESTLKTWDRQSNGPEAMFPRELYLIMQRDYNQFIAGAAPSEGGTAIRDWPIITPAHAAIIEAAGVSTVEQLAAANEQMLLSIGTGARNMRDRAVEWMRNQKERTVVDLKVTSHEQSKQIVELQKQIDDLMAALKTQKILSDIPSGVSAEQAIAAGKPPESKTLHLKK